MNELQELPNIGKTLASRLNSIGIFTYEDLKSVGSVMIYKHLQSRSTTHLPLCYNLYSLEAALRGISWRDLTKDEKQRLKSAVDK